MSDPPHDRAQREKASGSRPGCLRILLSAILVPVVIVLGFASVLTAKNAARHASWETTPGEVTYRGKIYRLMGSPQPAIAVDYLDFTAVPPSENGYWGGSLYPDSPNLTTERSNLGVGSVVTVHYDPAVPSRFTLEGPGERLAKTVVSVIGLAVVVGLLVLVWRPPRFASGRSDPEAPHQRRP